MKRTGGELEMAGLSTQDHHTAAMTDISLLGLGLIGLLLLIDKIGSTVGGAIIKL